MENLKDMEENLRFPPKLSTTKKKRGLWKI